MGLNSTLNLLQTEGSIKIKQADKGSTLSFILKDSNRNTITNLNGNTASIVLYDKRNNRKWTTTSTVKDANVSFKMPGNLAVGIYDLDITVSNMVFPSDRGTKIEVVEGALTTSSSLENAEEPIFELSGYAKIEDLDKKVDKVIGKGLSSNDFTNAYKTKVDNIPTNPKYTDTTYRAGNGLNLTSNTFSIDDTIARKTDLSKVSDNIKNIDIVNDLTSGGSDKALSAEQGKEINTALADLANKVAGIKPGYGVGDFIQLGNLKAVVEGELLPVKDWDFTGHNGWVWSVAVGDQGNVYSGSSDNKVMKISPNGSKIWEFTGHTDYVNSVAVGDQGNVYSGSSDNKVMKISPNGSKIWEFTGHTDAVRSVAVDDQGNVYSGSDHKKVMKISPSGSKIWEFTGHNGWIWSVAVDDQGNVYSGSDDKKVMKISPRGSKIWEFTGHTDTVRSVAVGDQGNVYSGSSDNKVMKISPNGSKIWEFTGHTDIVWSVAVGDQGNVYSGSDDNKVMKISPNGSKIWEFTGHSDRVNSVAVDGQGNVYSGSFDNKVMKIKQEGDTKIVGYEVIK